MGCTTLTWHSCGSGGTNSGLIHSQCFGYNHWTTFFFLRALTLSPVVCCFSLGYLGSEPWGLILLPPPPDTGVIYTHALPHPAFYASGGDLNSSPHVYVANTLPTEPPCLL